MLKLEGMNASCCLSTHNVSSHANQTGLSSSKIYVFLPLSSSTKLTLLMFSVIMGILAFFGNVLILCFVKSNQSAASFLKSCSFRKNFDVYISSLAISDALCAFIVLPLTGCQLFMDVFERGWGCKILCYLGIFFPSVTINNLLTVRSRMKRAIDIQCDNAIKVMKRAENRRLTMILVSIMLMFIFSYALSLGYFIFRISTRSQVHTISFESDFLIRYVGALLAFSNSLVNVIIYLVQMKDFRRFLKSKITSNFSK